MTCQNSEPIDKDCNLNKMLLAVLKQSTEGVAITDLNGNLLFVNNAFSHQHGLS